MASGTLGADDTREKHRWGEGNKVYTRKVYRKNLKNNDATSNNDETGTATGTASATVSATATATVTADNNNNNNNTDNRDDSNNINRNADEQSNAPQQSPQTLAAVEDANSSQHQQTLTRLHATSADSSSHNQLPQAAAPSSRSFPNGNGVIKPVVTRVDDRVRIDLAAARSKTDIKDLRRKLESELDQVRSLVKKLEAKEVQLTANSTGSGFSHPQYSGNGLLDRGGLAVVNSEVGLGPPLGSHLESRPFRQLSVSVMENSHGVGELLEKEKRTPKANQYYRNSEFLLGKDRLPPPESKKKSKSGSGRKHGGEMGYRFSMDKYMSQVFKSCSNVLARLMKHKHAWVFNTPVDAEALGILDYHDIIKHPMDLGTIKTRLSKNWYKSPREFAEDVRLTFHNAMTYNPKGQDVHLMAQQLLEIFEEKWAVIEADFNLDWRYEMVQDIGLPNPTSRKTGFFSPCPPALDMRALDRPEFMSGMMMQVDPKQKTPNSTQAARTPVPKKPKAKDPDKRDMTYEEKQRLSTNLQSLPPEKLDGIVLIIKKRNSALCQHDDEVEVDIDSVDAETLWELDRYVTNYKKTLSKNKRKAELALQARATHAIPSNHLASGTVEPRKESKRDENQVATSSPVQGQKQGDNASGSSSSSSSSSDSGSSSSDSDSDSSSDGSDEGHSPRT